MPIRQGGSLPNQPSTWPRRRLRRTTVSPDPSIPCTSKTFFARSRPIVLICFMDGSCCWCSITQLWHIDAVRGPSTPSWPATAGHPVDACLPEPNTRGSSFDHLTPSLFQLGSPQSRAMTASEENPAPVHLFLF